MLGTESSSARVTGALNHRAIFLSPRVRVYMMCLIWEFTHTPSYSILTGEKNDSWETKAVSGATHATSSHAAVLSDALGVQSKSRREGRGSPRLYTGQTVARWGWGGVG